jgi:hypothetical protein
LIIARSRSGLADSICARGVKRYGFYGTNKIGTNVTRADIAAFTAAQLTGDRYHNAAPANQQLTQAASHLRRSVDRSGRCLSARPCCRGPCERDFGSAIARRRIPRRPGRCAAPGHRADRRLGRRSQITGVI